MKTISLLLGLIRVFQVLALLMLTGAVLLLWLSDRRPMVFLENPYIEVPEVLKASFENVVQNVNTAEDSFSVHVRHLDIGFDSSRVNKVASIAFVILVMGFIGGLLEVTHRIALSVHRGIAFERANIRRIRWIGQWILAAFFLERLVLWGLSFYIESQLPDYHVTSKPSMGWMSLILGLSILTIGIAFDQARHFQEDSELTV